MKTPEKSSLGSMDLKACAECGQQFESLEHGRPRRWCATCRPPRHVPVDPGPPTPCGECGEPSLRKYCSQRCRDLSRRIPCAGCEKPIYRSSTSRPIGEACCRACRKEEPRAPAAAAAIARACARCGQVFKVNRPSNPKRYCGVPCANRINGVERSPTDRRVTRAAREASAPGLGPSARKALRDKWRAQGRQCIYCTNSATTIDHVLPLVRGGTNHEGNLAPCCKSCNSSKSGWTVIEWRTGKRLKPMDGALPWDHGRGRTLGRPVPVRKAPTGRQLVLNICDVCGQLSPNKTCSSDCHKDRMRNRYRLRVGIPIDAPLHSRAA